MFKKTFTNIKFDYNLFSEDESFSLDEQLVQLQEKIAAAEAKAKEDSERLLKANKANEEKLKKIKELEKQIQGNSQSSSTQSVSTDPGLTELRTEIENLKKFKTQFEIDSRNQATQSVINNTLKEYNLKPEAAEEFKKILNTASHLNPEHQALLLKGYINTQANSTEFVKLRNNPPAINPQVQNQSLAKQQALNKLESFKNKYIKPNQK